MLPRASADFYRTQQRITATTVALVRRQWATMGGDWDASWRRIEPAVLRALFVGQVAAARQSEPYLGSLLDEYDVPNEPVARVNPTRFAGVNGSGAALAEVLGGAVVNARRGGSLEAGGRWLDTVTTTAIADTSRASTAVVMSMTPEVTGYTRMLNPPSCQRCVILAGAVYKWNDGFRRHPGCDCRHVPSVGSIPATPATDPKAYFNSLDPAMQDSTFGKAGAAAIREGADMGQVVNARSGMYRASDGLLSTYTGAGGRRAGRGRRLMPEAIFEQAKDRAEAIELLRRNGFIVGPRTPRVASTPVRTPTPVRAARPDELPSSTLRFDSPKAEKLYGDTVKQLDELHRITPGALDQTRVIAGGKSTAKGGHFDPAAAPPKPRRVRGGNRDEYMDQIREWRKAPLVPEIRVNDRGDGSELLTFLHEFGHRADYLPTSMRTPSTLGSGQTVSGGPWYSTSGSPAVRAFQDAAAQTTPIVDAYKNWRSIGYAQYFNSPEEVWARAYSQWAANKLGGAHRTALEAMTKGRTGVTFQWSDEEFEKISDLVEGVLRERGLL